jgi:hypothetical protein
MTCVSATYCYTCGYDIAKRDPPATCKCSLGWWDDGTECRACIFPCIGCNSETFCTLCEPSLGIFADSDGLCKPCWYPCSTCLTRTHCLSCGWDVALRTADKNCSCIMGYYECGTVCKPCIPPCTACTSEINCLDCNNANTGTFYYIDYCRPCEYPCATCSSITSCLTCGYGPENRIESPTCPCKSGYFEMGYACV